MSLWLSEWNKFSPEAIKRMKTHSDKTHDEREWMCYVYDVDGTYELGEPSYGTLSRIEVSPEKKSAEDQKKFDKSVKDDSDKTNFLLAYYADPLFPKVSRLATNKLTTNRNYKINKIFLKKAT